MHGRVSGVWRTVIMYRTEIKAKNSYSWCRYFKCANLIYPYSFTNLFRSFVISHYCYWNLGNILAFMCSPTNDNYNLSYSRTHLSRKPEIHTWFYVSPDVFFAFWGAENHVYYIPSIRSRSYVLKSFGCLEGSNRVSNWNKR